MEIAAGDRRWGVASEGLGDRVATNVTDGGDRGVAQHMGGHGSAGRPEQRSSVADEEAVS